MMEFKWVSATLIILAFCNWISGYLVIRGTISPTNPMILTNDTLVANCTLTSQSGNKDINVTSKNLIFKVGDSVVPNAEVIDDFTIQVRLTNLSRFYSKVNLFCYAKIFDKLESVSQSQIILVDPLERPTLEDCVVHNWDSLECSWKPSNQDPGIKTDHILYISSYCTLKSVFACRPNPQKAGSCEITFNLEGTTCVSVCANNSLSTLCSTLSQIKPKEKVKPGPVQDVAVLKKGSRQVELKWKPPKKDKKILYSVTLADKVFRTKENGFHLINLQPYMQYEAIIRGIPLISTSSDRKLVEAGFFSQDVHFKFNTLPDVPDHNPQLTWGSFYFDKTVEKMDQAFINIFWKPIPVAAQNGQMNHTSIRYFPLLNSNSNPTSNITVDRFSPEVKVGRLSTHLNRHLDYIVEVEVCNEVGCNKNITPSRLLVPSLKRAPKSPDQLYAIMSNQKINVFWSPVQEADNYTVYWCSAHYFYHECTSKSQSSVDWTAPLPPFLYNTTISVKIHQTALRVGISVEKFDKELGHLISSGVLWMECIHEDVNIVLPPREFNIIVQNSYKSIVAQWSHPDCPKTKHITHYEVFWCKLDSDPCLDNNTNCCIKNFSKIISSSMTSYAIDNLELHSVYGVKVRSVSFDRYSSETEVKRHRVHADGMSNVFTALIIIACLLAAIVLPVGAVQIYRKARKECKKHKEPIPIQVPEMSEHLSPTLDYAYTDSSAFFQQCNHKDENDDQETNVDEDQTTGLMEKQATLEGTGRVQGSNSRAGGSSGISLYASVAQPRAPTPVLQALPSSSVDQPSVRQPLLLPLHDDDSLRSHQSPLANGKKPPS